MFYLKETKKLKIKEISILIIITSIINFHYFIGYGFNFMIIITLINLLLYLIIIYSSFYLIKKKYYTITIPSSIFILYSLFSFTNIGNFWLNFTSTMHFYPIIMRYIGSNGVYYLILIFNLILFDLIYNLNKNNMNSKKKIKLNTLIETIIITFLIIILIIQPLIIYNLNNNQINNNTIKIIGIQPNINQDWFERSTNKKKNLNLMINLTNKALEKHRAEIVIWPEYIFTHLFEIDYNMQNKLIKYSKKKNITLIIGGIKLENISNSNGKRYDSLYIINNGKIKIYNAYIPVKIFDSEVIEAKNNNEIIINNKKIGLAICYEENFQKIFSKEIKQYNPELFIVVGNLYYVKNTNGLKLISISSNLRAIENNRYIFRLETSGITKIINNYGQDIKETPINKRTSLYFEIPLINKKTFYSQYQKVIDNLLLTISIIILILNLSINIFNPLSQNKN